MIDYTVHHGDCLETLRGMADNSVDSIVTDPPYGLSKQPDMAEVLRHWLAGDDYVHTGGGFMGKSWDSFVPGPSIWREAFRVLKPGGHALVFAGSRTQDLMAVALRLAGFEIRDTAMWIYGSGFPKSLDISKAIDKTSGAEREVLEEMPAYGIGGNGCLSGHAEGATRKVTGGAVTQAAKQWEGWGTALKPAYEPIIIARKPLEGTVADNVLTHGVGGLNTDGCRIPAEDNTSRVSGSNTEIYGADNRRGMIRGGHGAGRWPANILHDGSDEVLNLFPTKSSTTGKRSENSRAATVGETNWGTANHKSKEYTDSGSPARFFYCAKASKADRNEGCEHLEQVSAGEATGGRTEGSEGLQSPRAGAGRTGGARNYHPTVKPTDLMRWCCRLVTPPGGMVLDLFAGSGSTGKAAILEGFNVILCEREAEYLPIIEARCAWALWQKVVEC